MRRGMTLIEVLLALALLGVLAGVGVSWITTSSQMAAEQSSKLSWERSATALLRSVHTDLSAGEFNLARDTSRATRRVQAQGELLSTRTRAGGEDVRRVYSLDGTKETILSWTIGADARIPAQSPANATVMLGDVASFELSIDEDYTSLDVLIESTSGDSVRRSYRLGEIP